MQAYSPPSRRGGKKQKVKKKRLFKVDLFNATFKLVGFR